MVTVQQVTHLSGIAVDEKPKQKPLRRFDVHRVLFWSSLGVVALWFVLASYFGKQSIPTLLDADGRRIARTVLYDNFPSLAKWIGIRSRQ